jgi:dTDP-4-amino-4,6-dideoxygalactose transaminase
MGEGGAIVINDPSLIERAEIIREKGTNRSRFWRGEIDKYTWVDLGSSYLPSEINAAYLFAQLEKADEINDKRLSVWNKYHKTLQPLMEEGFMEIMPPPKNCAHNGHLFYIKLKDEKERCAMMDFHKKNGIYSVFHYIPLHFKSKERRYKP